MNGAHVLMYLQIPAVPRERFQDGHGAVPGSDTAGAAGGGGYAGERDRGCEAELAEISSGNPLGLVTALYCFRAVARSRIAVTGAFTWIAQILLSAEGTGSLFTVGSAKIRLGMCPTASATPPIAASPGSSRSVSLLCQQVTVPSWDTNWTLNAVLVKKSTMMGTKVIGWVWRALMIFQYPTNDGKKKTIAEMALDSFRKQDGLESAMAYTLPWAQWRVPICISYNGLFIHEEIETAT